MTVLGIFHYVTFASDLTMMVLGCEGVMRFSTAHLAVMWDLLLACLEVVDSGEGG